MVGVNPGTATVMYQGTLSRDGCCISNQIIFWGIFFWMGVTLNLLSFVRYFFCGGGGFFCVFVDLFAQKKIIFFCVWNNGEILHHQSKKGFTLYTIYLPHLFLQKKKNVTIIGVI